MERLSFLQPALEASRARLAETEQHEWPCFSFVYSCGGGLLSRPRLTITAPGKEPKRWEGGAAFRAHTAIMLQPAGPLREAQVRLIYERVSADETAS